jgi:hypothetical protein
MKAKSNGYILFEDKKRVILAVGFRDSSKNPKLRGWIQIYILPAALPPMEALRSGKDALVCGDCPLRGHHGKNRRCYVRVHQAPTAIWKAWKRGTYPRLPAWKLFRGQKVRIGAYGDPAFIPPVIVTAIVSRAETFTAYTHQWKKSFASFLRGVALASVHSLEEAREAWTLGWGTFRTGFEPPSIEEKEKRCSGNCDTCSHLCRGFQRIYNTPHGGVCTMKTWERVRSESL